MAWKVRPEHYAALAEPNPAGVTEARLTIQIMHALVLQENGDYRQAMAQYDEAIRRDPRDANTYFHRGNAWANQGVNDKALADYNEAIRLEPEFAAAYTNRGATRAEQGDYEKALADFHEAIRLDPRQTDAYNGLVWIWATCPDARFRDGKQAVEMATRVGELAQRINPANLDTLAAAYAEAGDFENAVKWQIKAMCMVRDKADKAAFANRLELYRSGQPYRQAPRKR